MAHGVEPTASPPWLTGDALDRGKSLAPLRLCLRCLGRPFAKLGHGLGNGERGAAIATALGTSPSDETSCPACEGLFLELDTFVEVALGAVEGIEFATFLVGTRVNPDIEAREAELLALAGSDTAESITSELNREIGKRLEPLLGKGVDVRKPHVTIVVDTRFDVAELQIAPLFVRGRYRKLVRGIPQCRWPCSRCKGSGCHACEMTGKQYRDSVQDLIGAPLAEACGARDSDFHGMGREDVDARCLGNGRPFILELSQPRRRSLPLADLEREINARAASKVEVSGLEWSRRDDVAPLKEARPPKTYLAKVAFDGPVDEENLKKGIATLPASAIEQRTPTRVAHRRALLTRTRSVLDARIEAFAAGEAVLRVRGEAGLYVKELVSGDGGRTRPSLAELLGVGCRVVELDVVDVEET